MRMRHAPGHLAVIAGIALTLAGCVDAPTTGEQVMAELRSMLSASAASTDRMVDTAEASVWWITRERHSIINDGARAVELRSYGCDGSAQDAQSRAHIARLERAAGRVLRDRGFIRNMRNSSRSLRDDRFYDYVSAYERGVTKIVFTASPDCWSTDEDAMHTSVFVSLTEDLETNRVAQEPFLSDLNIGPEYIIHVTKQEGDFVMLAVNARRAGHEVIATHADGHWVQVFAGQDVPSCGVLRAANVPAGFSDCME